MVSERGPAMASFGELLRRLRGNRSQKEVANDLGMPITTLSSLENHVPVPRGSVLKRLANYYGVPVTYFYPAPTTEMKSSESALKWLLSVRSVSNVKSTVATYGSLDIPEGLKIKVAEAIRKKKHAEASHNE